MDKEFINSEIQDYAERYTSPQATYLDELENETRETRHASNMISGYYQGRMLAFLSGLAKPRFILEIGTYTGFSALCLAEGLGSDGRVITLDPDDQHHDLIEKYFDKSPYADQLQYVKTRAEDFVPKLKEGEVDLVFIDAAKKQYKLYLDMLYEKLSPGALIIVDNVLWSGKVLQYLETDDDRAKALHEFNVYITSHEGYENFLLPIRDGLMLARKKEMDDRQR